MSRSVKRVSTFYKNVRLLRQVVHLPAEKLQELIILISNYISDLIPSLTHLNSISESLPYKMWEFQLSVFPQQQSKLTCQHNLHSIPSYRALSRTAVNIILLKVFGMTRLGRKPRSLNSNLDASTTQQTCGRLHAVYGC